jgi:hypothetical protein
LAGTAHTLPPVVRSGDVVVMVGAVVGGLVGGGAGRRGGDGRCNVVVVDVPGSGRSCAQDADRARTAPMGTTW